MKNFISKIYLSTPGLFRRYLGLIIVSLFLSCAPEDITSIESANVLHESETTALDDLDKTQAATRMLPSNCNTIAIKGSNGNFVSSEDGQTAIVCNRTSIDDWETWTVIDAGNGKVAFQGSNGKYLSSENGGKPMICNRDAIGAWEKFTIVDKGGNLFSIKGNNNRFVSSEDARKAMTCNRTSAGSWEVFEAISLCDTNGGGATTPYELLGLKNWKLNGLSGSKSSNTYVDKIPNLSSYTNNNWFYLDNGWTIFRVWEGSASSGTSSNPRMELRELTTNGENNIYWDGTTSTVHKMKWKVRVDRLPSSGKICFGQIHERDKFFDDLIRIQFQGSANQTSGAVKMKINGYVTEELDDKESDEVGSGFQLGQEMYLELTFGNKTVNLYELNANGTRKNRLFTKSGLNADENYFKAGNYLQSVQGNSYNSGRYGVVAIKELNVFH